MGTYVHELGHAICLRHEFSRVDRNEYLKFPDCNKPPEVINSLTTRGHIFDYSSRMNYYCSGGCSGKPTMTGAVCKNSKGFTVVDTDKVNTFYNCKGCLAHRWYRVDTLTSSERRHLIDFATQEGDKRPLYLCRAYTNGHIFLGTYLQAEKACWIPFKHMQKATKQIQVFGLPTSQNSITNRTSGYSLIDPKISNVIKYAVRAGSWSYGLPVYAAFTAIQGPNGKMITAIGSASYGFHSISVWDPASANENPNLQEIYDGFRIIGCGYGSRAADVDETNNNNYFYVKSISE